MLAARAMASRNSMSALPVPPASLSSEHCVEPVLSAFPSTLFVYMATADPMQVLLNFSTTGEIVEYIVNARRNVSVCHLGSEPILSFHWQASQVHSLAEELDARLLEIDQQKIYRFEYDYVSKIVFIKMSESILHAKAYNGLRDYLKRCIEGFIDAKDPRFSAPLKFVDDYGPASIKVENKLLKAPDASFGKIGALPSLLCEVS
jgi:hypothetical protein